MVKILHQLGFRQNWNFDSLSADESGSGVICAPRYMTPSEIEQMPSELRSSSLFDPQFFIPSSKRGKLPEYDFFPEQVASEGFSTTDYSSEVAGESAKRCLAFQDAHGFESLVIPTRYREATPSDFIESQSALFVEPFLKAISQSTYETSVLLQVILNDSMLKDEKFSNDILNWVTGIPEISGIYLIPQHTSRAKQITDIDYLLALMRFIYALRQNSMEVTVGYLNTESVPLLAADPTAVTIGGYENLRMFSIKAFEADDGSGGRGPKARIYVSKLLQWISHEYIGAIKQVVDNIDEFFDDSAYRVSMFEPSYNWHFAKPEPYKHYYSVFSKQLERLGAIGFPDRVDIVLEECRSALQQHEALEKSGIVFDTESGSSHLGPWITALNLFSKEI